MKIINFFADQLGHTVLELDADLKILCSIIKIVIKTWLMYQSHTKNLQNNYNFS